VWTFPNEGRCQIGVGQAGMRPVDLALRIPVRQRVQLGFDGGAARMCEPGERRNRLRVARGQHHRVEAGVDAAYRVLE